MTDFRHSQHADDWDGYTERRAMPPLPAGDPNAPVTREYLDAALKLNRHSTRDFVGGQIGELKDLIKSGFPGGDPVAHCAVHQSYIDEAKERKAFWKSVFEKIATGAIYTAVLAVATAVWTWIKSEAAK